MSGFHCYSYERKIQIVLGVLWLCVLAPVTTGTKHSFRTSKDPRFFIGPIGHPYGYIGAGTFKLTVYDFEIFERRSQYAKSKKKKGDRRWWGGVRSKSSSEKDGEDNERHLFYEAGFLLKKFESESDFARYEESILEDPSRCAFEEFLIPRNFADEDDETWMEEEDDDVVVQTVDENGIPVKMGFSEPTVVDDGIFLSLTDLSKWKKSNKDEAPTVSHSFSVLEEGLYFLIYQVCPISSSALFTEVRSSFSLDISHHNYDSFGGLTYLTAGDIPLPLMYFYFTCSYGICIYLWMRYLKSVVEDDVGSGSGNGGAGRRGGPGGRRGIIHQIHHMMTILLCLKALSIFFESVRFHYISTTGHAELWSVVYYTFAFLKGVMLFTVILLIGSGWSFVKPFLHDREKKIIFLVLVLQVIDNVAIVILANETEGERQYEDWSAVLHLVDIMCCCAVLVPIVWQVNALEATVNQPDTQQTSHPTTNNTKTAQKLKLFRTFYLLVVVYIYFTRVIVYLFATFLTYKHTWFRYLVTELGTLAFYVITGYTFRPVKENPYMELVNRTHSDDEDDGEVIELVDAAFEEDTFTNDKST